MKLPSLSQTCTLLAVATFLGACAPYPPAPRPQPTGPQEPAPPSATDETTRQMEENRRRLKEQEERRRQAENRDNRNGQDVAPPRPAKKNYPTAAAVPGREGFVFNPFTNNIVDVRGIASGKLVRDPDDADASHKFRVP